MLKIDNLTDSIIKDFRNECQAMEALRHPNICMFLGACTKPPNLALVLEVLEIFKSFAAKGLFGQSYKIIIFH
jgi:hypothetical protein